MPDLTPAPNLTLDQARSILTRTASVISQRADATVEYSMNGQAYTDGQRITIPPPDLSDPDAWARTRGYVDHESAHILYTQFDTMTALDNLERTCLNLLEDVRINSLIRTRYPGSIQNIRSIYQQVVNESNAERKQDPTNKLDKTGNMLGALQRQLERLDTLGLPADHFSPEGDKFANDHAPRFRTDIDNAQTTTALVQPAKDLAKLVRDPNNKQQSQRTPTGHGQQRDRRTGKPISGNPTAQQAKDQAPNWLEQKSRELLQKKRGGTNVCHSSNRLDEPKYCDWTKYYSNSEDPDLAAKLPSLLHLGAGLRENLKQALKAQTITRTSRDQLQGNLDLSKLATIASRVIDPTIYTKTVLGRAVNTAIHVVLDQSSSMDDGADKWPTTAAAAAILTDAAAACGAKVRMSSFNCSSIAPVWADYGQTLTRTQWLHRMARCNSAAGTPTSCHLQLAARTILTRPEPRKIIVVITDGQPEDPQHFEMLANVARRAGVEVYAVGIYLDSHAEKHLRQCLGQAFVSIQQLPELRNALLNLLTQLLLKHEGRRA